MALSIPSKEVFRTAASSLSVKSDSNSADSRSVEEIVLFKAKANVQIPVSYKPYNLKRSFAK